MVGLLWGTRCLALTKTVGLAYNLEGKKKKKKESLSQSLCVRIEGLHLTPLHSFYSLHVIQLPQQPHPCLVSFSHILLSEYRTPQNCAVLRKFGLPSDSDTALGSPVCACTPDPDQVASCSRPLSALSSRLDLSDSSL